MMRQTFEDYISRTAQIRELATPHLKLIDREERYGEILKGNFRRIGELATENRRVISEELYPLLLDPDAVTGEEIDEVIWFARTLINAYHLETLDPGIGWYLSDFLYKNVYKRMDLYRQLRLLELHLLACYNMCLKTRRIEAVSPLAEKFRREGLEIFRLFERYLERLEELPDEACRTLVLENVRFGHCMYEGERSDAASRAHDIEGLEHLLRLAEDEQVRRLVPSFDWDMHRFRVLEYLALSVDYGNIRGFSREEARRLNGYARELSGIWHSDPAYYEDLTPRGRVVLAELLNTYYAGEMGREDYKAALVSFAREEMALGTYSRDVIYSMFHASLAYLMCVKETPLTPADQAALTGLYEGMTECALHSRDTAVESYVLELASLAQEHYIEVPDFPFEKMVLSFMAALHTPTYIHSLMVGDLTVCLTRAVLERRPELFIGILGIGSAQEAGERGEELIAAAKRGALVHDAGKTPIIDTIFIYERNLLDFEFNDIIKIHPRMGQYLLNRNASTREGGSIALGHHRWYDDSFGYPADLRTAQDPLKTLIDIVTCADCMDAATDGIGRSYNRGKTLEEYISEVREGAGTRYAPWILPILEQPEVCRELREILTSRREQHYRDTYWLLKKG